MAQQSSSSEVERLKQQLKESEEQLKQERGRAKDAENRAEHAENRAEHAENRTRQTNLEEYVEALHELWGRKMVQLDQSLSTQGSTTSSRGKCCPERLQAWSAFPELQQGAFDQLYRSLQPHDSVAPDLFSPLLHITELGNTETIIGSERDLMLFHHTAVENPVRNIMAAYLKSRHQAIVFENHANTLNDLSEEVQALLNLSSNSPASWRPPKAIHADQLCVFKHTDGSLELISIIEYKAPHKLSKEILRSGLKEMDVRKDVIDRITIPNDPYEKFCYKAELLVSKVVAQVYSYMLESGVEYSCIATGEAFVFLWVRTENPRTVYYHLAEPSAQALMDTDRGFPHPLTAVSQLASFCLLATQSQRRGQLWRDQAKNQTMIWEEDWYQILRRIPEKERKNVDSPEFLPRTYTLNKNRSPYHLRKSRAISYKTGCTPEQIVTDRDPDDPSAGSNGDIGPADTPSRQSKRGKGRHGQNRGGRSSSSRGTQQRAYCTQACLLGLVKRMPLDPKCPNIGRHRQRPDTQYHLLTRQKFRKAVQEQLGNSLDDNLWELKLQGRCSNLFAIRLASHGYTFVAKGTREVFVPDLKHEGSIYERLQPLQGSIIPVYLGNIDLKMPWRDLGVEVIHMLLMTYCGRSVKTKGEGRDYITEKQLIEQQLARLGVCHNDLRDDNLLLDDTRGTYMCIDFDQATIVPRKALQEVSVNETRKHASDGSQNRLGSKRTKTI